MFRFFTKNTKRLDEIKRRQALQRREIERNVCAMVARGNISLQHGNYITQEDMDKSLAECEKFLASKESKW